jgi:hypothetical protein
MPSTYLLSVVTVVSVVVFVDSSLFVLCCRDEDNPPLLPPLPTTTSIGCLDSLHHMLDGFRVRLVFFQGVREGLEMFDRIVLHSGLVDIRFNGVGFFQERINLVTMLTTKQGICPLVYGYFPIVHPMIFFMLPSICCFYKGHGKLFTDCQTTLQQQQEQQGEATTMNNENDTKAVVVSLHLFSPERITTNNMYVPE